MMKSVSYDPITLLQVKDNVYWNKCSGTFTIENILHDSLANYSLCEVSDVNGSLYMAGSLDLTYVTITHHPVAASSAATDDIGLPSNFFDDLEEVTERIVNHEMNCRFGRHEETSAPMQLAEKQFNWWYICKHCGKAVKEFESKKSSIPDDDPYF